jgi:hypothetical protein
MWQFTQRLCRLYVVILYFVAPKLPRIGVDNLDLWKLCRIFAVEDMIDAGGLPGSLSCIRSLFHLQRYRFKSTESK